MPAQLNIRLYPWFVACSSLLFWFPVFFLYFSSKVSIDQVLVLEAIYYACVVLLEVPSGYLSDLAGRRITLIFSSVCALSAYILFVSAGGFGLLALAQCSLAAHIAFRSGTDSSLLYESLVEAGKKQRIGPELARAQRYGLLAMALAALAGGVAGGFNLALPYLLAAAGTLATLFLAFQFKEPGGLDKERGQSIGLQLGDIRHNLRRPTLRWLFIFSTVIFVLVHVPYEYFQPYVRLLFPPAEDFDTSPPVAGLLIAITMTLGSVASTLSIPLQQRAGTANALLLIMLLSSLIIVMMASTQHWLVLLPIMLRSVPMAMANPVVESVLHQNIPDRIRASFMSTLSLFSRLAFALTLLVTALLIGSPEQLDFERLRWILIGYLAALLILSPFLLTGRKKLDD